MTETETTRVGPAVTAPASHPGMILFITSAVVSLTGISLSIMTVAFPKISQAFPDTEPSTLSWIANLFTIVSAATLVPAGVMADRVGRKKMLLIGVALFTAGSLLGGFAPSPAFLMIARSVLALGSSAFTPAAAALLIAAYPPERLSSAIGIWAVAGGVSSAAGPAIGGPIIEHFGWEWAFWCAVPVGVLILVLAPIYFTESRPGSDRALPDPFGAVLVMVAVSALVLGVVQSGSWGWTGPRTIAAAAIGLALFAWFVWRCANRPNPLIELDLFDIHSMRWASIGTLLIATAWFCIYWGLVQFSIGTWKWTVLQAGVRSAPVSLFAGFVGITVGRLASTRGHRLFIVPGAVLFGLAALWFWLELDETPDIARFLVGASVLGIASGLVFPSFIAATVHDVPKDRHAIGSGVNFMLQRIGTTLGVALAITFIAGKTGAAGLAGFHHTLVVALVGAVACFVVAFGIDTRPRPAEGPPS
jgi:EmrB/QacA subfamily drug resistance transporter